MLLTSRAVGKGHVSLNLTLRRTFNLFANVRPCVSIKGYKTPYDDVNTVLIRENTEGEYSGIEHEVRALIAVPLHEVTEPYFRSWTVSSSPSSSLLGTHPSVSHATLSTTLSRKAVAASQPCTRRTSCRWTYNLTVFRPLVLRPDCRKMSDGMFLSACRQVAKDFPNIKYDEDLLDRVCLQVRLSDW